MCGQLQKVKEQLSITKENVKALEKELEGKNKEMKKNEQAAFDLSQVENEKALQAQLKEVCRGFYQSIYVKALNATEVDPYSKLRNPNSIIYPPTLRTLRANSSNAGASSSTLVFEPSIEGRQKEHAIEKENEADK